MDPGRSGTDVRKPPLVCIDDGCCDEEQDVMPRKRGRALSPFGIAPPVQPACAGPSQPPSRFRRLRLSGCSGGAVPDSAAASPSPMESDRITTPLPRSCIALADGERPDHAAIATATGSRRRIPLSSAPERRRWSTGLASQSKGPVCPAVATELRPTECVLSRTVAPPAVSAPSVRAAPSASSRRLWPAGAVQLPAAEVDTATPSSSSMPTRRRSTPAKAVTPAPLQAESLLASAPGVAPPSLDEFFQFLQCQLRMEARELLDREVELADPASVAMWADYEAFARPNLGANERWVPYHTCLGVHERFLIEEVHHRSVDAWDAERRFLCMFVFRAHCKRELFNVVQLPILLSDCFWADPVGAFADDGEMERKMLQYRRNTGKPMLTLAFLMIPERVLQDDDANLVRSVVSRTRRLLEVAGRILPVVNSPKSAEQKFEEISKMLQATSGLGETWAKMIMVCIDLAYPDIGLLQSQCNVGRGASPPLRVLLGLTDMPNKTAALKQLTQDFNATDTPSSNHFWQLLALVEADAQHVFRNSPLILRQVNTKCRDLTAVTLQVQLCEYRQFRKVRARLAGKDGDDWLQLLDTDRSRQQRPENAGSITYEEQARRVVFGLGEGCCNFVVQLDETQGRYRYAERVASICLSELRLGVPREDVQVLLRRLCQNCRDSGKEDVSDESEAWEKCRAKGQRVVQCSINGPDGARMVFQTTVGATRGNIMEAERIARLCYDSAVTGASKEFVLKAREWLYRGEKKCGMVW